MAVFGASLPGILIIIYGFIAPKKEMVYDRLNNIITIPRPLFLKDLKVPFNKGEAVITSSMAGHTLHTQINFIPKGKRFGGILTEHYLEDFWNFTVWYMDKNRPLPPGTAFDEYRQRDYDRRKSEGFPKPLYPSNLPTPEATKEQQEERKRIGGW